ncbi:MAG: type IVB secretion system coupling complex protein DotM/IcmP [Gammaproteobacteria bacterium]
MAGAPQGGNQGDNSAGIIWGVAASFAFILGIWYVFGAQMGAFYLHLKLFELDILSWFDSSYFENLRYTIQSALASKRKLAFGELIVMGNGVGEWLRYPFVILMVILAFVVYFGNSVRVYKRVYSMKEFANLEKSNWPQITPVTNLNLLKVDIDVGPWAMAMTPIQFCKRHGLLEEVRPLRREGMSRRDWDKIDVVLKKGEATKVFALQLGPTWPGVKRLPPHIKALFAVFAARINADSNEAARLLAQFSASSTGKMNFSGVDALLAKHENTKLVQKIVATHAYVTTVMASMLAGAREDGVQASADFLWLKPLDRRLWYTLNTVGRQTPFPEVAGIFAHWVAEKQAGQKLLVPIVDEATKALEIALKEVIYRPDEVT